MELHHTYNFVYQMDGFNAMLLYIKALHAKGIALQYIDQTILYSLISQSYNPKRYQATVAISRADVSRRDCQCEKNKEFCGHIIRKSPGPCRKRHIRYS